MDDTVFNMAIGCEWFAMFCLWWYDTSDLDKLYIWVIKASYREILDNDGCDWQSYGVVKMLATNM